MSQRKFNFVEGEFYHLYNRGADKRVIFKNNSDYERFQSLLYISNNKNSINIRNILRESDTVYDYIVEDRLVAIGAYCLMPNHYHILVTPLVEGGLSQFMQKLSTSYSMYFNKKHERTGVLFEGKFKSQLAAEDNYLKYLYSYIHLNPIKIIQSDWKEVGIKNIESARRYLGDYRYSSYLDMVGKNRPESKILDQEPFPKYFNDINSAEKEVISWLQNPA